MWSGIVDATVAAMIQGATEWRLGPECAKDFHDVREYERSVGRAIDVPLRASEIADLTSDRARFEVDRGDVNRCLYGAKLMKAIREVARGDELTFGRSSPADKQPAHDRRPPAHGSPHAPPPGPPQAAAPRGAGAAGSWSRGGEGATTEDSSVVEIEGRCRRPSAARHRGAATSPARAGKRPPRRRFVSLAAVSPVSYAGRHDADAPITHISTAGRAWRRWPPRQRVDDV